MCEFFKKHPRERMFLNVNLSNFEYVLKRNLRAERAWECIFRASGGTFLKVHPLSVNQGGALVTSGYVTVA